jgi:ATP-dependent DNA helicase 2 subunit 2
MQRQNEALLRSLTELCGDNGIFATASEVIASLAIPDSKSTRPYATYEGRLTLGDPEKYEKTALYIDVKRYFNVQVAKPASAKIFVIKAPIASTQSSNTINNDAEMTDAPATENDLISVKSTRTYRANDPNAPGGRRDVDLELLARGYEYGSTAVPISESDENVTNFETKQSFSIIGFIPSDKVCHLWNFLA